MPKLIRIPARQGKSASVSSGQPIRVVNTHGQQVVDTWAFSSADVSEFMSMEHTRTCIGGITPRVGQSLYTNLRRPILTIVEDDSGGVHDTLVAACDPHRYHLLGCVGHHDNCTENLARCMAELNIAIGKTPCPWNLFMNVPVAADGAMSFLPPVSTPGSGITLRAEMDMIIVFSACPQDMVPINGAACEPTDAHFTID